MIINTFLIITVVIIAFFVILIMNNKISVSKRFNRHDSKMETHSSMVSELSLFEK